MQYPLTDRSDNHDPVTTREYIKHPEIGKQIGTNFGTLQTFKPEDRRFLSLFFVVTTKLVAHSRQHFIRELVLTA